MGLDLENWVASVQDYAAVSKPWRWSDLVPSTEFRWEYGATPFSNIQVILVAWVAYFVVITALSLWMRNRPKFEVKSFSLWHNRILMVWSAIMFAGIVVGIALRVSEGRHVEVFCVQHSNANGIIFWFGGYLYYLSKFYELLDTVIMVLRKTPLTFLHVYHHAIVVLMVWLWLEHEVVIGVGLGSAFNTFVHVLMYHYFAQRVLGKDVWFKRYITQLQIVQFVSSFVLSLPYVYLDLVAPSSATSDWGRLHNGHNCSGFEAFCFSAGVNATFLVLFARFYAATYSRRGDSKTEAKTE